MSAAVLHRGLISAYTAGQAVFIGQRHRQSVFWLRRLTALGGEEQAIAGWQIKRDGTRRGIVEIVDEQR